MPRQHRRQGGRKGESLVCSSCHTHIVRLLLGRCLSIQFFDDSYEICCLGPSTLRLSNKELKCKVYSRQRRERDGECYAWRNMLCGNAVCQCEEFTFLSQSKSEIWSTHKISLFYPWPILSSNEVKRRKEGGSFNTQRRDFHHLSI